MGNYNSGRTGGRPTSEACASYVLDVNLLNRARLRLGVHGTAPITFSDGFSVSLTIDTRGPTYWFVTLEHKRRNGDGSPVRYRVQLVQTRPTYGGVRWWFLCPRSGRRVAKLFLPLGGSQFCSRQAYGLGYACQRGTPLDRAHMAGRKLAARLGAVDCWPGEPPEKPHGMRWRTYERLVDRWQEIEARLEAAWLPGAVRLVRRLEATSPPKRSSQTKE